jgi:hypothetical protein
LIRGRKKYVYLSNPTTSEGLRLSTWLRQKGAGELGEIGSMLDVGSGGSPLASTTDYDWNTAAVAIVFSVVSAYIAIPFALHGYPLVLGIPFGIIALLILKLLRATRLEANSER